MQKPNNINNLHTKVRELILEARSAISKTVNFVSLVQNWEIGRMIVEEEQGGKTKAEYGKFVIKELSEKLTQEFGSGYSYQHLMYCRQFYTLFPIHHAMRGELENHDNQASEIHHVLRGESAVQILNAVRAKSHPLFQIISPELSWTHYRSLLRVENPKAREFYINEAIENGWGTRALNRQINSLYYERLL